MTISDILASAESQMDRSIAGLQSDLAALRAGRPTPDLFSSLRADYYGSPTPLASLASFSADGPNSITVQPFDPSSLGAVEKSIRDSDLTVNLSNDGHQIRCVFPDLTADRRRELVRAARAKAETTRIGLRSARRDARDGIEELGRSGGVGRADLDAGLKSVEALVKSKVDEIGKALAAKEKALLEV